jgi:amino acid transporter
MFTRIQLTASSRQTFAFARDGALPFSRFIYKVNKHTLSPVNAVWCTAFLSALLALLAFAGAAAIGAVFSLAVIGQYLAYSIPISARFLGGQPFTPGPFNLGVFVRTWSRRSLPLIY